MLLTPLLTRRRTRVLAAFASVAALVVLGVTPVQAIPAQAEDPPPQVLLLMDASGSMKEPDPSGSSKMDAAKKALDGVIQEMPDSAEVGLRVYGATEAGGEPTPAACADTQLVAPIAELDRATLGAAVEGFQAKGETPIAHSLEQAAADFSGDGAKRIILVSDGEESCVPDPCPQVESLADQDIDLTIDIVGLAVDAAAKDQLSCLTEATGGTYYDAADAGELADGLQVLTQRAVRDFTFTGKPTKGGEQPRSATPLTPGSWTTTLPASEEPIFFVVDRTDATLNFTVTSQPEGFFPSIEILGSLPDAVDCGSQSNSQSDTASTRNQVFSTQYSIDTVDLGRPGDADEACFDADSIVLAVTSDAEQPVPAMLTVDLEASVTGAEDLKSPPGLDLNDTPAATGEGEGTPLVGGLNFATAPEIGPGRYRLLMGLDESAVIKVPVEWGQQLSATSRVRNPGRKISIGIDGFGPDLGPAGGAVHSSYGRHRTFVEAANAGTFEYAFPEVSYANRSHGSEPNASRAGFYYLTVFALADTLDDEGAGQLVTVELDIARNGEAGPEPDYATAGGSTTPDRATDQETSTATAAPPAEDSSTATGADNTQPSDSTETGAAPRDQAGTPSYLVWLAGGSTVVLLAAGGALWALLRRRT